MVILFDLVSISDLNLHPCNLFQHTYMLVLPEINFLHLLLPVTLLLVGGWMTPTPSQGPPIPQGGGGLMGYDHDHGRGGGGGDPEPGTYIAVPSLKQTQHLISWVCHGGCCDWSDVNAKLRRPGPPRTNNGAHLNQPETGCWTTDGYTIA